MEFEIQESTPFNIYSLLNSKDEATEFTSYLRKFKKKVPNQNVIDDLEKGLSNIDEHIRSKLFELAPYVNEKEYPLIPDIVKTLQKEL